MQSHDPRRRGSTRIAHRPDIERFTLSSLASKLTGSDDLKPDEDVRELRGVTVGAEPWILESSDQLALVRRLEADFPSIEEAGCKVGIGVATGADKAFIGRFDSLDVEPRIAADGSSVNLTVVARLRRASSP